MKIWIESLVWTIIIFLLSWLIVEWSYNIYLIGAVCIILPGINAIYSAIKMYKSKRNIQGMGMICILPSTIYMIFVMIMVYIVFFMEWKGFM